MLQPVKATHLIGYAHKARILRMTYPPVNWQMMDVLMGHEFHRYLIGTFMVEVCCKWECCHYRSQVFRDPRLLENRPYRNDIIPKIIIG